MTKQVVQVPHRLLRSGDLLPSVKLIWMVSGLGVASGTTGLSAATGLSRPTVIRGRADLAAAGWDPGGAAGEDGPSCPVPGALLLDCELGVHPRVI